MRPPLRTSTSRLNTHRTVFHDNELALFFRDGNADHEGDMVFNNESFRLFTNEEHDINEENIFQETSDWLFLESIASLVLHRLFLLWTRLNDTIGRHFE